MRGRISIFIVVAALAIVVCIAVPVMNTGKPPGTAGPPPSSSLPDPALERRVAALEARLDELNASLRRSEEAHQGQAGPPLERGGGSPATTPLSPADFEAAVAAAMERREREFRRRDFVRNAEAFLRSISHQVKLTDARRDAVIPVIADWHEARDRALHGTAEDMAGRDAAFAAADAALGTALRGILPPAEAEAIPGLLGASRPDRSPR